MHRPTRLVASLPLVLLALPAASQSRTWTTNADFDEGLLVDVNHDPPNRDQLQLDEGGSYSLLSVACGGLDTVVRLRTDDGTVVGEYRTAPAGLEGDPSRATTDLVGNVWVGNRLEDGSGGQVFGSVAQVGVVVGGTRTDATGQPDPRGQYLAPPFLYSTVVDRDGDGLIRTSRGLGDVLAWPDLGDGLGGNPALVQDSEDEMIRVFQRTQAPRIRHLSVDPLTNDLWAGGYPTFPTSFDRLDGTNGALLSNLPAVPPGCGGYAGIVSSAGVLWSSSELEGSLFRKALGSSAAATCIGVQSAPRGVAEALDGAIWVAGGSQVVRVTPDGQSTTTFSPQGAQELHGIAVDPAQGDLWVASSGSNEVLRLDGAGAVQARVPVGTAPRGVAFDGAGKLWVANQGSDDVMRIDPVAGAVDLVVALRPGSAPYNPSDMTGGLTFDEPVDEGTWTVVRDGGAPGVNWTAVRWSDALPGNARIEVEVRAAASQAGLAAQAFAPVANGGAPGLSGRFLEVRARFLRSTSGAQESPVLFDLTVEGELPGGGDDCVSAHRRRAGSLLVYPEFLNEPGALTVLTVTHVGAGATEPVDVEFVYIDGDTCEEFNRVERLTPDDTLSVLTSVHDPDHERGYVYAFARDPKSGEPITSNTLVGQLLVISAGHGGDRALGADLGAFEYAVNPLVFEGLAVGPTTDLDGDGLLDLDGEEYAMAADELLVPRFFAEPASPALGRSELVLIALSGGARFDVTVDFLVHNDAEQVFSAEHTFRCWEKIGLAELSPVFTQEFLSQATAHDPAEPLGAPQRETGWMRLRGAVANSSAVSLPSPAIHAVLIERVGPAAAADAPFELCTRPTGSLLPRSVLGDS